jgi:hypothetical protein
VTGSGGRTSRVQRRARGQATVETALVIPVVVVLVLTVLQAGLLVRDRLLVVHAARGAARAVAVHGSAGSATAGLADVDRSRFSVAVGGDLRPGGLASVTVRARPVRVPLVGLALGSVRLEERLVVRVEGP